MFKAPKLRELVVVTIFLLLATFSSLNYFNIIPDSSLRNSAQLQDADVISDIFYSADAVYLQPVPRPTLLQPADGVVNPLYQCSDGKDNDNDGLKDLQDPGCTSYKGRTEVGTVTCTDTDNGSDLQTAGTLKLFENGGVRFTGVDICQSATTLQEFRCSGATLTTTGQPQNTSVATTCQYGCSNGACTVPGGSLSISGSPITIGTIAAGSRVTKTINVQHTGPGPATDISFSATVPFSIISNTCSTQTTSNCTVTVGYIPTTIATAGETGTLTTSFKNAGVTQTVTTQLKGFGLTNDFSKVLFVYNTNSTDSVAVKDYYLSKRPGVAPINVIGIPVVTGDLISITDFNSTIRTPIMAWINANPTKPIKYIILARDIPSRISGFPVLVDQNQVKSVQTRLENAKKDLGLVGSSAKNYYDYNNIDTITGPYIPSSFPGTLALITHMDMGTLAATKAYIDKIASVHGTMTTPNFLVSGTNANVVGSTYFCEDSNNISGEWFYDAARQCNYVTTRFPTTTTSQIRTYFEPYFTDISDVRGLHTWGVNGRNRNVSYATNGELEFTGKSNWYVLFTLESWNGIYHYQQPGQQGNFEDWFSPNAFGGTNYSNTPVGTIVHTHEPGAGAITAKFFYFWESGFNFADAAWAARRSPVIKVLGDPLLKI